MVQSVGIIGAGFAGLVQAKIMKQFGFDVTVYEKAGDVGGVWSATRRYPGLSTQNNKDSYCFSDFPMPKNYPEWPSGQQMQKYLQAYAEHFEIAEDLLLNTKVTQATNDPQTGQWTVSSVARDAEGSDKEEVRVFDFLVVCNGIFSTPLVPNFNGAEQFISSGGKICHTSELTNIQDAKDKNVVLIGYGKSSCDLAVGIHEQAKSTTIVARHIIWKMPKHIMNVLNFKHLLLTRMGEALFPYIRLNPGMEKFLHGVGKPMRNSMLGSLESAVAMQCKLKKLGLQPKGRLETIARSTVSLVSDGFFKLVEKGKINVIRDTEIAHMRPGEVELTNGQVLPADVVACGTGWIQHVPFFDESITSKIFDERGNFRLYRTVLPLDIPNLFFNGYNSSFFSPLSAEVGALWTANYLLGGINLPTKDQMKEHVDGRLAWMEDRTEGKHAKGTNIIPFSMHQIDDSLNDMDLNVGRMTRIKQWLRPVDPANYAVLTKRLLKRHKVKDHLQVE